MILKSLSSVERSKNLILQISSSFLIKGLLFFITYAQFPVFNKYLSKEEFGLWMTFLSFYNWFILFDFGIGHGLKNILTEKLSLENNSVIKKYSSSGIMGTLLIAVFFIIIFEVMKLILFNHKEFTTSLSQETFITAINFTFYSCIILFLHNTFSSFIYSIQKTSYANYLNLLVNTFLLIAVFLLLQFKSYNFEVNHLLFLSQINFLFYLIFFVFISWLFLRKYQIFLPGLKDISWKYFKEILDKGSKFFFIQVTILALLPIDSFLVANFVSTSAAGDYNVLIKIYSIIIIICLVISQSSWPSITEAYYKNDLTWLKSLFKKILFIIGIIIIVLSIISYYLNDIISLWMGENYYFSNETIFLVAAMHIFCIFSTFLSTILYSTNFLKSQMIVGTILVLVKILLIYLFVIEGSWGLKGILTTSLVCYIIYALLNIFYFVRKFKAVWN